MRRATGARDRPEARRPPMNDQHDFEVILDSRFPLVSVETHEETRFVALIERVANLRRHAFFVWTATDGLRRCNHPDPLTQRGAIPETQDIRGCLRHIHATLQNGIYVLLDVHHYLSDPVHQRLLKSTALDYARSARTVVLVGHKLDLPEDLDRMCARFALSLPDEQAIRALIKEEAQRLFTPATAGGRLRGDQEVLDPLVKHLVGLTLEDARRLVRHAIQDGMLTWEDLQRVIAHKHKLVGGDGVLTLELDTARFSDIAGLSRLKRWLEQRREPFLGDAAAMGLDPPRGVMLLGVQGGGKSMAAKAVAGAWGVPLMRIDFGALYSKWLGETERALRESLKGAEAMAPCVLWIDEIEKGLATGQGDSGESRRILGTLLTWMAERRSKVFLVATANDIEQLPPELIRKGRMDEIFFVDLPDEATRAEIFGVHLDRRRQARAGFDVARLAAATAGFSGAEIEQAIVSALYESHARREPLSDALILEEIARTRPLSVVMREKVAHLRAWARDRAVPAG